MQRRLSKLSRINTDIPVSYSKAMTTDNTDFRSPGVKKEEVVNCEIGTVERVERTPTLHVIPSRYVFRVEIDVALKVSIVAKDFCQGPGV